MTEKNINKVVYGNEVLIDLSADTVAPENVDKGITFHDKSGNAIEGTSTKDSDTSDATLLVSEAAKDKIFYANGAKCIGTAPINGGISKTITTRNEEVTIPIGYHDGSGKVSIDVAEQEKLIAANIKQGITVLGVEGEYTGEGVNLQSKTVTPSKTVQTVQPDTGYDALSSVTVNAIPYTETENAAGGITVTIGG